MVYFDVQWYNVGRSLDIRGFGFLFANILPTSVIFRTSFLSYVDSVNLCELYRVYEVNCISELYLKGKHRGVIYCFAGAAQRHLSPVPAFPECYEHRVLR